jgi:hypothetical protein
MRASCPLTSPTASRHGHDIERLTREPITLRFVANAENVIFVSAEELTNLFSEQMPARLAALCKPKLLLIDEMGYLPLTVPVLLRRRQAVTARRLDTYPG